jgi:hypothetical protein
MGMNFKQASIFVVILLMALVEIARAWEVDFSRRQNRVPAENRPEVAPVEPPPAEVIPSAIPTELPPKKAARSAKFESMVKRAAPLAGDRQEFVILNTPKGFVPSSLRIHKGLHYTVHVVNVNEEKKNVSFMLDGFNEHHATFFGKIKTFNLDPDKEGVFEFQCPETSAEGRLIVLTPKPMAPVQRSLSSEK